MKKVLASFWVFVFIHSAAFGGRQTCEEYMLGIAIANPNIPMFGGSHPRGIPALSYPAAIANLMLKWIPIDSARDIQIAVPVSLRVNDAQPQEFGDGTQNAGLSLGQYALPPFVAMLERDASKGLLHIKLVDAFPGIEGVRSIEVSVNGFSKEVPLKEKTYLASFEVDLIDLGWSQLHGYKSLYFRPVGWNDWFSLQFPNTHYWIDKVLHRVPDRLAKLPSGESIVDPLKLRGSLNPEKALLDSKDLRLLGFEYGEAKPRIHGEFLTSMGRKEFTAVGSARSLYRLPHTPGFSKLVYLAQLPRNLRSEATGGLVSGTGPHRIGAPAETIFNSLGQEPLMTFHGISAPSSGPRGENLAYRSDFDHLYIGKWLRPGWAFVATQGTFHQHLTHTTDKAAFIQVLTPPEVPNLFNNFGFGR